MEFYNTLYHKKAENVNEAMTFEGLRNEFIKVAKKFYSVQREHEAELKEIKASGIYADKYIRDKEAEFRNKEASIISEYVGEIKETAKKVIDKKKSAINSMLSTAPTQEQINLLQSLKMQGKSLSKAEIIAILPELANNYRALKTMQSIAEGVGYSVMLPSQYDYEEMSRSLEKVEQYLADRIDDIGKPAKEWSLASDCFFGSVKFNLSDEEWEKQKWEDPLYSEYAKVLDGNIQTAPTVEPVKELTKGEKMMLDRLFEGKVGEDLKESVREASESSNIADLIKRSEYAEYLAE
jgi:hypothetical protein